MFRIDGERDGVESLTKREISEGEGGCLPEVARRAIRYGVDNSLTRIAAESVECVGALMLPRPSFVTLHLENRLRGCMGHLETRLPLAHDVAYNAHAAAFEDPRFPPVQADELEGLCISVSVLSRATAMKPDDEADLIGALRPGIDGLTLRFKNHRSTLLPSAWSTVGDPAEFVLRLKEKAGLSGRFWSAAIVFERYTATVFE